ncbi:MAG: AMP-dependent synthetase/ligase [Micromonosporaceae bacterium]
MPRTLCEAFQATAARDPDAVALRTPGDAVTVTWRQYADRVRSIAAGLAGLGVGRGDTVGIMLTNRPEFHLVDMAALHLGATPFSIYNSSSPEQIRHLFGNADNRIVVTEEQFVERLREATAGTTVERLICVDDKPEGTTPLETVEAAPAPGFDFEASWRAVRPDDVLTIIYTSGTTGPPKGAELTHANFIANYEGTTVLVNGESSDRIISYLPDAHAANRWLCHYANAIAGAQVTTVDVPKQVIAALTEVRPTLFLGVPATWYKIKAGIEGQLAAATGVKAKLGQWAVRTGIRRATLEADRMPVAAWLKLRHRIADRLVLSKVREKLGLDAVRIAVSGAAPFAPEAHLFILGLGIPVYEGWGMTELTAAATVNRRGDLRVGTVGLPLPNVEIKLAEDNELLVRGPNVMKGYRNDPEKTAETIDSEGWLHTGDIGSIDEQGYVRIVDRKKELIINAAGKNMSPSNIENAVKVACPLAGSVVVIGDNRPYVTALIVLDADAAAAYAEQHGHPDVTALATDPTVRAVLQAGVDAANQKLSRVEQVKKFAVLPTYWEPGGDELTPTMKLKRRPIAEKYAAEIEQLYP